ncbi:hypothetical protein ACLOJK_031717 [Asimina triloba]
MINDLPTVYEVVTQRKQVKNKSSADSGSKSRVSTKNMVKTKMNTVKPSAEAAVAIIMGMNSGFAVTYVKGGFMGSA